MKKELLISQVSFFPVMELRPLMSDADAVGLGYVRELEEQWREGKHRFSLKGEALFVFKEGRRIHGLAGIDRRSGLGEKYANWIPLFVRPEWRRQGHGKKLALTVLDFAAKHFHGVQARSGGDFCEKLGFLKRGDTYLLEFAAN